ncbi:MULTISPECIES: hypothetical protein [unclassified Agarivorans]|nr:MULTISPECIES: hypothetical protein [unclassified Agarivorans]MDO6686312.1 hypothetical protein [Agarivorans sp. 3_MG-2023]MDO6713614.1 hypothetical protein [Agarivorans sp. 2_MG-2023]
MNSFTALNSTKWLGSLAASLIRLAIFVSIVTGLSSYAING